MNIYIGNLSRMVTEADLRMMFDGIGEIVYAKFVAFNEDERARGYAFVHIKDDLQAKITVAALHGKFLKGLILVVRGVNDEALETSVLRASLRSEAGMIPVGERRRNAPHLHLGAAIEHIGLPN